MTAVDAAQLASIIITVGALLPLVTSIVQQQRWSPPVRTVVGVAISTLAGIVTYVTQFGLNFSEPGALVVTIVGMILAAGAAYKTIWQPSGVAPALESASSPKPRRAAPEPPPQDGTTGTTAV